jgi:hypothetical protein
MIKFNGEHGDFVLDLTRSQILWPEGTLRRFFEGTTSGAGLA